MGNELHSDESNEMKWNGLHLFVIYFVLCALFIYRKTNHHFVSKLEMYWCNRVSREGFKTLSPFFICSFQLSFHICIMRTNSHQREINFGEKPGIFLFEISSYPFFCYHRFIFQLFMLANYYEFSVKSKPFEWMNA